MPSTTRTIALAALRRLSPGDIRIRHHYTRDRMVLDAFRHRGYWYHGKRRERPTMDSFARLVSRGDTVVEVGGHIGYIALYFSHLVGPTGRLVVFEPGSNNLPYLRKNLASSTNARIVESAAGAVNGQLSFFQEELTGQNNSLLPDYEVFEANAAGSSWSEGYSEVKVDVVRLDDFTARENVVPEFMKVDVEGAELEVLRGSAAVLDEVKPMLMVEITREREEVASLLTAAGYLLFTPDLQPVGAASPQGNVFGLHPQAHSERFQALGLRTSD